MTMCISLKFLWRDGEIYHVHLHGSKSKTKQAIRRKQPALTSFWLCAWSNMSMGLILSSETSRKISNRLHGLTSKNMVHFLAISIRPTNPRSENLWRIESVVSRNKVCDNNGKFYPLQPLRDVIAILIFARRRDWHYLLEQVTDDSRGVLTVK
jgi:hypothetical protein